MSGKHTTRLPLWLVVLLVAITALSAWLVLRNPHVNVGDDVVIMPSDPVATSSASPSTPSASVAPTSPAIKQQARPVRPESVKIDGIGSYGVFQLPRVYLGGGSFTSPVPPNFDANSFAWDEASAVPGSKKGVAIFTSHTYSDGSAMANQLLAGLHVGDKIVVKGKQGNVTYVVTDRVTKPLAEYPSDRVTDMKGTPQLSITVCSGTRLGPGNWSHRTVWFAELVK